MTQFGLFQGPENVKVKDASLSELAELRNFAFPPPRELAAIHRQCLRGFIGLHFRENPDEILSRPLLRLGGRTLEHFILSDYSMAYAWTMEYRLHPEEKALLIEPYRKSA